ncbi:TPT-domain-containing protein [Paraphaeosphaeria sporulosa]|uniref:TPT-domain-containing protein n=1 Tax=Paraphaeosphaeria sporulosa TaxID=1460663 RepID=A0A177CV81_9PLEO|nr:TPT-domain-containing protein [Paraphaeosphaeria sporulosa]OAG11146.1 TPT-domain-containing protein [Paraphaeosphaeria sporulosa]
MQRSDLGQLSAVLDEEKDYVESNRPLLRDDEKTADSESQVPGRTKEQDANRTRTIAYLGMYFVMNLSLTFYNKLVLGSFAFPWILTSIHTGTSALGCSILLLFGHFQLSRLTLREHFVLIAFSFLFTLNIAMSNVSLEMVSIPFHQVMRATTPVFCILIYRVLYARSYAPAIYASIIPVIAGVGLATFGDYHFTALGFTLTLSGVVLAAVKTVVTNRLMTGRLKLPAYEVLLRMGPLAAMQSLLYSVLTGEFSEFLTYVRQGQLDGNRFMAVAGNGILAFALNVASFQTNKLAGALSMTICANLKQCLTIVLGAAFWNIRLNAVNGAGILLALAGGAWYSSIEVRGRTQR